MLRRNVSITAALAVLLFASLHAQRPTSATPKPFPLTVDSIMRGPDLVGNAPTAVRWSGDSQWIYFAWQKPGEDEASTYVVARAGGDPRKLSEEEARQAPPAGGRWDKARRRLLAADRGDIVIYDRATGARRQITKTDGAESGPRWARNDTAVTFVQGGNLFVVSVDGTDTLLTQLTSIGPRRADPPLTESQRVLRDEEQQLLDIVRERAEQRKKTEAEREKDALPRLEISARQSVGDIQLSPDGRYAWVAVTERPAEQARTADVPSYITDSAYAEMIPTRTNVGDAQSRGRLAVIDLQQKKARLGRGARREARGVMVDAGDLGRRPVCRRGRPRGRQQGPLACRRRSRDRQGARDRSSARRCVGARGRRHRAQRRGRVRHGGRVPQRQPARGVPLGA